MNELSKEEKDELASVVTPEQAEQYKALAKTWAKNIALLTQRRSKHQKQRIVTSAIQLKKKRKSIRIKTQIKRKKARDRRR